MMLNCCSVIWSFETLKAEVLLRSVRSLIEKMKRAAGVYYPREINEYITAAANSLLVIVCLSPHKKDPAASNMSVCVIHNPNC